MKYPDSAVAGDGRADASPRILVVDDEIFIRELLVRALGQLGHEQVDSASNGAEAWEALQTANYCLVITDHKMPRVTGLDLIARMRSEGMLMPVILISGAMPEAELNQQPGLRVDALLTKPFTLTTLSATVEKLLPAGGRGARATGGQASRIKDAGIAAAQGRKNSSRRILVVDDNRDCRQWKVALLASAGYQVEAASDGADGWEALRTCDYDLVVTDNQMPRMTGLEMLEKLYFSHMTVPVIMATGHVPTEEFARKPWLKPEATLQTPFTHNDLLAAICNVLEVQPPALQPRREQGA